MWKDAWEASSRTGLEERLEELWEERAGGDKCPRQAEAASL